MTIIRNAIYELDLPKDQRHNAFLSAYDLDLRVTNIRIKIGRFSYGILNAIKFLPHADDEMVLEVGCFCEAAQNVKIIVGGNHHNDRLFNFTFSSGKIFKRLMEDEERRLAEVTPARRIVIEDNVVLSDAAIVTPGTRIGYGSIIGAGALVSGTLDALGIYGGVPAKLIKARFKPEAAELYQNSRFQNVAAHSMGALPVALRKLELGEIDLEQFQRSVDLLDDRPVIEATLLPRDNSDRGVQIAAITGFRIGKRPIEDERAIQKLKEYFSQIHLDQPKIRWTPDIFDALNLYRSS